MKQQDLFNDLPRGEQLAALRRLKLEAYQSSSGKVSGAVQKTVLKVIDDHQGRGDCFASQETIAEETGYGVSTIRRAVAALVAQDLITRERVNNWTPNRHRINWTEVNRLARGSSGIPRVHGGAIEQPLEHGRDTTEVRSSVHGEPRNAPINPNSNAPSTATPLPGEWMVMRKRLFDLGMKAATVATTAAHDRGWSIEYVDELIDAAMTSTGLDSPPGIGWLCNWMTGKADPPFDESEVLRRRDERQRIQAEQAEAIRQRVTAAGQSRQVAHDVIQGTIGRRLRESGLEICATATEIDAAERLDRFDKERAEKRPPDADAPARSTPNATIESSDRPNASRPVVGVRRVPPANRGTMACDRKREALFEVLAGMTK